MTVTHHSTPPSTKVDELVGLGAAEKTLRSVHPMLSLSQARARVVRIVQETADTKTFVMHANALWQGRHTTGAGQFVRLQVDIGGQCVTRAYSLSSRPGACRLAITVKRQPEGWVSRHLHETIKVGDVLNIGQPEGEFVLPSLLPDKMLLLSAGIGIAPVMAMLRDLQARNYPGDLAFFHVCHDRKTLIFAKALAAIEAEMPTLSLIKHFTRESGHFTPEALRFELPDLAERSTWMSCPAGMMAAIQVLWRDADIAAPLYSENFAATQAA